MSHDKHLLAKPAMRDGVSPSTVWLPAQRPKDRQPWPRILDFLVTHFDQIAPETWQQRFNQQKVLDAQGQALHIDAPYQPHSKIYYYRELEQEYPIPFQAQLLYQNDHLLVVDKPHFLPVAPTGRYVKETLLVRLKQQLGNANICPIHRLDRETAGVMLFSLQPETRHLYQGLFQERKVYKTYEAIAAFQPYLQFPLDYQSRLVKGEPFFTMREISGEANSTTYIHLLDIHGSLARYGLHPITGKQHQLRVHMAALGMPILNDPFYPKVKFKKQDDFSQPLQLLAKTICFHDPVLQQQVCFDSKLTLNFPSLVKRA